MSNGKKLNKDIEKIGRFSMRRSLSVALRVLNMFRRDRRTMGMMLVIPAVIMVIFGLTLSGEIVNLPIILDNQDVGFSVEIPFIGNFTLNAGQNITDALVIDERVEVIEGIYEENIENVENGSYFAVVHIPEDFSYSIFNITQGITTQVTIKLYLDATKPPIRASIVGAIHDSLSQIIGDVGIEVEQILAFDGAQFTGYDVGIPAVMGFVITFLLVLIGTLTVTRERIMGTEDRLYSTPLSTAERLTGYVISLLAIAASMIAVILLVGVVAFGATVRGNFFMLILVAFLFGLAHVFLAVFLSNFAANELQAIQFAPLTALPSMALSGMLVPINSLPLWLQPISKIVPLTYGINLFEGVMLKGWGFKELWVDFLIVAGMALLFFILAILTVRNRMKD